MENASAIAASIGTATGYWARHVARTRRAETTVSPCDWHVRRRIGQVKSRLLARCDRLVDIDLERGFVNQSHKSDAFCTAAGMAPAQRRREHGLAQVCT